jgi:hypothetical protein
MRRDTSRCDAVEAILDGPSNKVPFLPFYFPVVTFVNPNFPQSQSEQLSL